MNKLPQTAGAGEASTARAHEPQIPAESHTPLEPEVPYVPPTRRSGSTMSLFPEQYEVYNQRISDEMTMDDFGWPR